MSGLHPIMAAALAPFAPPPRDTYRGWHIARGRWPEPSWVAYSPNYDASYEGPEDGWVDNGEKADAETRDELMVEIDNWFAERVAS